MRPLVQVGWSEDEVCRVTDQARHTRVSASPGSLLCRKQHGVFTLLVFSHSMLLEG